MAAHAFPVPTKQFAAEVQGVHTEFVLQGFDNRVLVVVTQLGKVGTVLQARSVSLSLFFSLSEAV
jgi:proteasome assembly chaperone 3